MLLCPSLFWSLGMDILDITGQLDLGNLPGLLGNVQDVIDIVHLAACGQISVWYLKLQQQSQSWDSLT